MFMNELKKEIITFSKQLGFDYIGFVNANNKTIISFAIAYSLSHWFEIEKINTTFKGEVSLYTISRDYHYVLEEKLKKVADFIERKNQHKYKIFVDKGPIQEKALAQESGIGWIGKNTLLITPDYGSWVFLGEIITNIEFEKDKPFENKCGNCNLCVESCPTGALDKPYKLDLNKCLSSLTQKGGEFPQEYRKYLENKLYGCDICQKACPYNKKAKIGEKKEFLPLMSRYINLEDFLKLDKKEFFNKYKSMAFSWVGLNRLKRNAIINLGNTKDKKAIPILKEGLKNPSPIIKNHITWSIDNILS